MSPVCVRFLGHIQVEGVHVYILITIHDKLFDIQTPSDCVIVMVFFGIYEGVAIVSVRNNPQT